MGEECRLWSHNCVGSHPDSATYSLIDVGLSGSQFPFIDD